MIGWFWGRVLDRLVPSQAEIDRLVAEHRLPPLVLHWADRNRVVMCVKHGDWICPDLAVATPDGLMCHSCADASAYRELVRSAA